MSWFSQAFSSSVGRKIVMALTGIFLIVFLAEHLISNFLLLKHDGGAAFNEFAHFMKYSNLIRAGEVVLLGGFLFHIIDGIILIGKNRSARPVAYAAGNKSGVTNWASKYMGPFGIVILVFLVFHLYSFFRFKYISASPVPDVTIDGVTMTDMSTITYMAFQSPYYVIFYVLAMVVVGFHLYHGFQSAFQSLGLNHVKYNGIIKITGILISILVSAGFAAIPVAIYFGSYIN